MFTSSFDYGFEKDHGILWLEDLNGDKSLTNDMENALIEITYANNIFLADLSKLKIMYKDSTGTWDGVKLTVQTTEFLDAEISLINTLEFFSINETDFELAMYRLLAHKE